MHTHPIARQRIVGPRTSDITRVISCFPVRVTYPSHQTRLDRGVTSFSWSESLASLTPDDLIFNLKRLL